MKRTLNIGKKLSAAAMIIAMVMMMAASVFAEDTQAINSQALVITKVFGQENVVLPDETFTFVVEPVADASGVTDDGLNIYPGIKTEEVSISFDALSEHSKEATVTFEDSVFDKVGAYRYTVKEVVPAEDDQKDYIEYDESVYTIELIVDGNGIIQAIRTIDKNGEAADSSKLPIEFNNKCSLDSLVITKSVEGSMGDQTKQFEFTLDIPVIGDDLNLAEGAEISYEIERADGSKEKGVFTVGGNNVFTLAHGEELVILGLPEGMIYTVSEAKYDNYSTEIIWTTYVGNHTNKINITGLVYDASDAGQDSPIVAGGNTIEFINTSEYVVPTGVILNVMPYILLLIVGIGGAGLFFHKRRQVQ